MKQVNPMSTGKNNAPRRGLKWLVSLLVLAMAMPVTMGCGEDMPGPPDRERRDRGGDQTTEIAADQFDDFEEADEYTRPDYPVRRNPFRPSAEVFGPRTEGESDDDGMRPAEPLEEFALSQLSLVTIISETTVPRAMFIDPSGYGHFAKEGDRIGRNNGVIRSIRRNEVEVREGDDRGAVTIVRMHERELRAREDELTDEEREALRRLLETDSGRRALEDVSGREREERPSASTGSGDQRFPGMAPPGQNR